MMSIMSNVYEQIKDFLATKIHIKILAWVLIIVLARADYSAMYNMFSAAELDIRPSEARLYATIFAICLEGIPTFMGAALAVCKDKTRYKVNDEVNAKIGFWIGLGGIVLAFALAVVLRWMTIHKEGGFTAFWADEYKKMPVDVFLMGSPILTSVLAFLASWIALRTENEQVMEAKVTVLFRRYLRKQKKFREVYNKFSDKRLSMWTSITDGKSMPHDSAKFKEYCYEAIRRKLISNCLLTYPTQIEIYNGRVENTLKTFIVEMSTRTTIPDEIAKLELSSIIEKFDEHHMNDATWDYTKTQDKQEKEVREFLETRIPVVQYKVRNR